MESAPALNCGFRTPSRCANTGGVALRANVCAMLTIQRRHSPKCPDRSKGPNYLKCRGRCLLRACGATDGGRRVRVSLKTRDLQRAARRVTEIEDRASGKPRKTISDAVRSFQAQH